MANIIQGQKYTLSGSGITSSQTTIPLNSFNLPDGSAIVSGDLAATNYGTLEPGTSREEIISFTGLTSTTLTGVTRGLKFVTPYTADASLKNAHAGNTIFVLSNNPQVYTSFVDDTSAQTVGGVKTFSSLPATTAGNPVADNDIARKAYVDSVVAGSYPANRLVVAGTAGETIANGNLIYFDSVTTKEWMLADADTAAKVENVMLGIAQGAGTDGAAITDGILLYGTDDAQSGMTIGDIMYASDTAGAISSTPGTKEVTIGIAKTATTLYFYPRNDQQITEDEQDALAGTSGTPSASNKYVTDDDTTGTGNVVRNSLIGVGGDGSDGALEVTSGTTTLELGIDKEQTTTDGTTVFGESDSTTKYYKIAQSFTAGYDTLTGIKLWKIADTGTFTGDVTVELFADSTGPTGGALATVTHTNAEWLAFSNAAEFTSEFVKSYTSTVDTTYWIVLSTSTDDNSNHPNLGHNSAGGYADGSVMFNNTTDGWVDVATIDLYFKTTTYDSTWNYSSISISSGAILNFSGGTNGRLSPVLKCSGNFNNAGTLTTVGLGPIGGIGGPTGGNPGDAGTDGTGVFPPQEFFDGTVPSPGLLGTGGSQNSNTGTGGAAATKNATYFSRHSLCGAAGGAGGAGGTCNIGGTPGTGGDGGAGSLGLILEIKGTYSNSGIITANGGDGGACTNGSGNGSNSWGPGAGGAGGGGAAGSIIIKYKGPMDVDAEISGIGIAFVDSGPDTITDSNNGFINSGFTAGQTITVVGTANNDGVYTIDTGGVAAGTLTLVAGDELTAEAAGLSVVIYSGGVTASGGPAASRCKTTNLGASGGTSIPGYGGGGGSGGASFVNDGGAGGNGSTGSGGGNNSGGTGGAGGAGIISIEQIK